MFKRGCILLLLLVGLMIPIIIMGGILSGWFTPTEAGIAAVSRLRAASGMCTDRS